MEKKEIKGKGKRIILLSSMLLFIIFCSFIVSATGDVAYIYRNKLKIDNNIVNVFSELNLTVDKIQENNLTLTNFSKYKIIFVGDERFRKVNLIPIFEKPSVIANYYHGKEFGLTDGDGISKLASNAPLSVKINSSVLKVYTIAKYNGVSIPYYYLDDENKAPGMNTVARTYTGNNNGYNFGDVISYASAGTNLINGNTTQGKICFYGIIETKYWTPEAKQMFKDCINYVGTTCYNDDDCPDEDAGEKYCSDSGVYQDVMKYSCENPGTVHSQCVDDIVPKLIEDCNDSNISTEDKCMSISGNATCTHNPIRCFEDSNCSSSFDSAPFCSDNKNLSINHTSFTCENKGTANSFCSNNTIKLFNKTCADVCELGVCKPIVCRDNLDCGTNSLSDNFCSDKKVFKSWFNFTCLNSGTSLSYCVNNSGNYTLQICPKLCSNGECIICSSDLNCNDNNNRTVDECTFAGTPSSFCRNTEVNCMNNLDCGFTGFSGNEYCFEDDIFKNYQNSVCNNPGTLNSSCSSTIISQFTQDCGSDSCSNYSSTYCKINDVYKSRTCFDKGCLGGSCFNTPYEQETFVQNCDYGCFQGACEPQCYINSECGNVSNNIYCSGNNLVNITTFPLCMNNSCSLNVINNTILCEFGCSNSTCLPGIHDVALIDFTNSINGILFKYNNNTEILQNTPLLICGDIIKANVKVKNQGNYTENITLTGKLNSTLFLLSPIINSIPGGTNDRSSLSPYIIIPSIAGFYNITIEAIIPIDNFPLNNIARRQIQVICPECFTNNNCGSQTSELICQGKNITNKTITPTCQDGNCTNITSYNFVQTCEDVCLNGHCEDIVCYNNSNCGSNEYVGDYYCQNNDVFKNYQSFTCVNPGTISSSCSSSISDILIGDCVLGCLNGKCLGCA